MTADAPKLDETVSFGNLLGIGERYSARYQFFRFMRSRVRFKEHPHGPYDDDQAADIVTAFLHAVQDCYHLKDWLKRDPWGQVGESDHWEKVIKEDRYLSAAADLCNASKHAGGKRRSRSSAAVRLEYRAASDPSVPPDRLSDFYRGLRLYIGEEELHPADFLDKCAIAWHDAFVRPMAEDLQRRLK